jgi:hypothetical protein
VPEDVSAPSPCGRFKLSCVGVPVACLPDASAAYIATDLGEWVRVNAGGKTRLTAAPLSAHTAAVIGSGGDLAVSLYNGQIARLTTGGWNILQLDAPALCLCTGGHADYVGAADGAVIRIEQDGTTPLMRVRDPVIALASYDAGLLVLGSGGIFGCVDEPVQPGAALKWIETGSLGRLAGFFTAIEASSVGVFSATQIGIALPGTGTLTACPKVFDDGIRDVVFLGARSYPYAVITDRGEVYLVDAGLTDVRPVRLPGGNMSVCGCVGIGGGRVAAWARDGKLYAVAANGLAELLAADGVVFATALPGGTLLAVVRHSTADGTSAEFMGMR